MYFTFWKPYVILFNSLALFPYLFLLWQCHLWYFLPLLPQLSLLWKCLLWYWCSLSNCYTINGTALTIVGTIDGSTLPLITFCAFKFVFSCSFFTPELELPPSSTLFFFLKTLLREYVAAFFMFSSVVYVSSLVLLTLVGGLCGLSFWCINKYWNVFANTKAN